MSLWRQLSRGLRALTNRRATDAELNDEVLDYLDRSRERERRARHDAQRRASRRAGRARQSDRHARARARRRMGEHPRDADRRRPLRTPSASLESRLHRRQRDHAGARHRGDDRHFQRDQPHSVQDASLPARRPCAHGLGRRQRRDADVGHVRNVSRDPAAQSLVRRARAVQAVGAGARRAAPNPNG